MQSHIRKVYACLAVTCHLHFWQDDRGLLRATAVTRGWNGYRNKSQHRKLTLEKKILPPPQQGFEPVTFRSRVRSSNHWAIPAPRSCRFSAGDLHLCILRQGQFPQFLCWLKRIYNYTDYALSSWNPNLTRRWFALQITAMFLLFSISTMYRTWYVFASCVCFLLHGLTACNRRNKEKSYVQDMIRFCLLLVFAF